MPSGAWRKLSASETESAWNRFYFAFHPGATDPLGRLDVHPPGPSVTWDLAETWNDPDPLLRDAHVRFNRWLLDALVSLLEPTAFVYAFDVNHYYQAFYPHRATEVESWLVTVLPDGDYTVFVAPDLSFGTFGHCENSTLCIFGQALIEALGPRPSTLRTVIETS